MVRATLDSNVWVSSFNFRGRAAEVVDLAEIAAYEIQISDPIVAEVLRTLRRKFVWAEEALRAAEADMNKSSRKVAPRVTVTVVEEDPDDNKILECALASNSEYVVTGDKHLLALKLFEGISIGNPAEF